MLCLSEPAPIKYIFQNIPISKVAITTISVHLARFEQLIIQKWWFKEKQLY